MQPNVLSLVEAHMAVTKVPQSRLGRLAVGDTHFIEALKAGRKPGPATVIRLLDYMRTAQPYQAPQRKPVRWTPEKDGRLWELVRQAVPRSEAAAELGFTLSAVHNRVRVLSQLHQPSRSRPGRRLAQDVAGGAASVLAQVERHLSDTGESASAFGRRAAGDPRLVFDMREGRAPGARVLKRVKLVLSGRTPAKEILDRCAWTPELDRALWALVEQGATRAQIAARIGVTPAAAACRILKLADEYLPDRPAGMPVVEAIKLART